MSPRRLRVGVGPADLMGVSSEQHQIARMQMSGMGQSDYGAIGRMKCTYPGRKSGVLPRTALRPVPGAELRRPACELWPLA